MGIGPRGQCGATATSNASVVAAVMPVGSQWVCSLHRPRYYPSGASSVSQAPSATNQRRRERGARPLGEAMVIVLPGAP